MRRCFPPVLLQQGRQRTVPAIHAPPLTERLANRQASEFEVANHLGRLLSRGESRQLLDWFDRQKETLSRDTQNARLAGARDLVFIALVQSQVQAEKETPTETPTSATKETQDTNTNTTTKTATKTKETDADATLMKAIVERFRPLSPPKVASLQNTLDKRHDAKPFANRCLALARSIEQTLMQPDSSHFRHGLQLLFLEYKADEALGMYRRAQAHPTPLGAEGFHVFVTGFLAVDRLEIAIEIWGDMVRQGIEPGIALWNAMLDYAGRRRSIETVEGTWKKMSKAGVTPDRVSWTTLIDATFRCGAVDRALDLFGSLDRKSAGAASRDTFLCNVCIRGLVANGAGDLGRRFLDDAIAAGMLPDAVTYNTLLSAHVDAGDVRAALGLVREMDGRGVARDVVTYTVMLKALLRGGIDAGVTERTGQLLDEMQGRGVSPNAHTYMALVDAAMRVGEVRTRKRSERLVPGAEAMAFAEGVLRRMQGSGVRPTVAVYTSLIKGYMLRGDLAGAEDAWARMRRDRVQPDAFTWNTLIEGYVVAGEVDRAHERFTRMLQLGVRPSRETFSYLLNGCYEAGLGCRDTAQAVIDAMVHAGFTVQSDGLRNAVLRAQRLGCSVAHVIHTTR